MNNRILVTGATGNIGSELVKRLRSEGADFVAGINKTAIRGVECRALDFGDPNSLEAAMEGVDTVFLVTPAHPEMVQWGKNVVDAAKACGVSHVVRSSGVLADRNSSQPLDRLLGEVDEYLKNSGLDFTIIAPNFFMQNFSTMLSADYKQGQLLVPAGDGKVAWVDVRDIAAIAAKVLLDPPSYRGQTLAVTGDDVLSYGQAVQTMNEELGASAHYVAVSDEVARSGMKSAGFPEFFIDAMVGLGESVRRGDAAHTTPTIAKILGRPPIRFEQFVRDHRSAWT